jgi:hypothetical protein
MAIDFEEILTRGIGAKWEVFAHVSDSPNFGNPFALHAYQFRCAAEQLIEAWEGTSSHSLDVPIAYLCRHYLELSLKSAWETGGGVGFGAPVPMTHDLSALWMPLRKFCLEHSIFTEDDEFVASFEGILVFLNDLDKNSTAFRYPMIDRSTHVVVDVPRLRKAMDLCTTFFYGLDAMMTEY